MTNVGAATGAYEFGTQDNYGLNPPAGSYFFWLLALEENFDGGSYISSYFNFKLRGSDGTVYAPGPGYPSDKSGSTMDVITLGNNEKNGGWMEFKIPAGKGTYDVLWTEDGVTTGVPMARVDVNPTAHVLKVTSAGSAPSPFTNRLAGDLLALPHGGR